VEVVDSKSSLIFGSFTFVHYIAGFATIPDDLEHIATRIAIGMLQHGMPPGAGHGTQLDGGVAGMNMENELRPYMRIEFGAWGDIERGQVTPKGYAGWNEL